MRQHPRRQTHRIEIGSPGNSKRGRWQIGPVLGDRPHHRIAIVGQKTGTTPSHGVRPDRRRRAAPTTAPAIAPAFRPERNQLATGGSPAALCRVIQVIGLPNFLPHF
ncbi:hypothetical protein GCM10017083_03680 [Thalassobaculum fulvum]|uniref:Uncharacterized protein n=1 Tax=Thalassobaculum fulvum TaxID=1633335 RepID=A0A918XNW0_9PROT|nr:hypothetical protein GCM10017083_03680 [Thalassobaculum fulvum]